MHSKDPTPYPEANTIVRELVTGIIAILGARITGIYLDGSLATGDFDMASDIDFMVITHAEIDEHLFAQLKEMHAHIASGSSPWAIQIEGSYISKQAIRRFDPQHSMHPNIERGSAEALKMQHHDAAWVIHRYVLRELGIVLQGPAPRDLIDMVSPDDLRTAMHEILSGWASSILNNPTLINSDGYQSYVVLSLCRILYTLEHGTVVSKRQAMAWALDTLGEEWRALVTLAWVVRAHGGMGSMANYLSQTLDFVRYVLRKNGSY